MNTSTASNPPLNAAVATSFYRQMLLIRRFEERVHSLFQTGVVHGTTHLCSGQEAVAVGFAGALGAADRVTCTYRGHGHLLSMGTEPEALFAELFGRESGVNGGRAGSMNIVDPAHRVLGCYGIVGGSVAAATGAGLSLRRSGGVAVAYFGDGAVNQAYFYECMNLAKVLALPVVYVCENNGYGEYTAFEAVTAGSISARAAAMDVAVTHVDGMDVAAVHQVAVDVLERVRTGGEPEFVEARTYRFAGHSKSDPGQYRPEGELDHWRQRDPLKIGMDWLTSLGITATELARVDAAVVQTLAEAEEAALAAPFPTELGVGEFSDPSAELSDVLSGGRPDIE